MKKEDEDMEVPQYDLNDIIEMKKEHPCHKSKQWKIIRMGADIRIKCLGCGSSVLMPRVKFEKKLKRVVEHAPQSENAQENLKWSLCQGQNSDS